MTTIDLDRRRNVSTDAPVVAVLGIGERAVFALGDGSLHTFASEGDWRSPPVHRGAILSAVVADRGRVLSGGEDGRVVATDQEGRCEEIFGSSGRWVESVAADPQSGRMAWVCGREVHVRGPGNWQASTRSDSTPSALAFDARGRRLGFAHYGGVTLWLEEPKGSKFRELDWKGSHISLTWSPDNSYVVTGMQENALHVWELAATAKRARSDSGNGHLHMRGYPAKTRSFGWSPDGRWLATSGAESVVVWPFDKGGPAKRRPKELGAMPAKVATVAFHPSGRCIAAGYIDGTVLVLGMKGGEETLVRRADGHGVTAVTWFSGGDRLAVGTRHGDVVIADYRS